jgi:hypothetical protein
MLRSPSLSKNRLISTTSEKEKNEQTINRQFILLKVKKAINKKY